jgi:replicative DNA helicase
MAEEAAAGFDRVPPHNLDAEESVLGSMILSHPAVGTAQEMLSPNDFYKDSHRKIFEILIELFARGSTTDPVVLAEELKSRGLLEAVGDKAYIHTLVDTVPNPYNISHYAQIVRDMSIRRNLIDAGYNIVSIAHSLSDDVAEVYDRAEDTLFQLGKRMRREGLQHIKDPVVQSFNRMAAAKEMGSRLTGVPTGFDYLDELTNGLQPSNLIVVGGRTSMGKTSFALNVAQHAALHERIGVLVFSLEMSSMEIADRFIVGQARINSLKYRQGTLDKEEWERIVNAAGLLSEAPIYLVDMGDITIMEMRTMARQLMAKEQIGLVIVDYIQLLYGGRADGRRYESRAQEVSKIARDLKVMAMDLEIPIIAVSQLRRPAAHMVKKEPSLEDLKESGGIEQNADMVLLLYRPEVDEPSVPEYQGIAQLHIAKHRNGQTGKFKLAWIGEYARFEHMATEEGIFA